jgi:hypothetical protein
VTTPAQTRRKIEDMPTGPSGRRLHDQEYAQHACLRQRAAAAVGGDCFRRVVHPK